MALAMHTPCAHQHNYFMYNIPKLCVGSLRLARSQRVPFSTLSASHPQGCGGMADELFDDAASSVGGDNLLRSARSPAMRCLLPVLAGKAPKLDSLEARITFSNAEKIAKIIRYLHANPSQITAAEVLVLDGASSADFSKVKRGQKPKDSELQALNTDPKFDHNKVHTLGDIPHMWLWGFLRKHCAHNILDATVSRMSQKSNKPLRRVVNFFTGRLVGAPFCAPAPLSCFSRVSIEGVCRD